MAQITPWDPNSAPAGQKQAVDQPNVSSPRIPQAVSADSGKTVVNTQALTHFGNNINELLAPVSTAQSSVNALAPVAAGAFDKAWTIQGDLTGDGTRTSAGTDLKTSYGKVLTDLSNGLNDLVSAVKTMAQKYTTTDDLNNMKASDLQQSLDKTTGDFGNIITDGGGSSGSGGGSSGSGGGSSGSGGGTSNPNT